MSAAASATDRIGDWIQTYSGRPFWPLDPRPEDICIQDIAHALAMKCRYGGHSLGFYSVAEHSVLVSQHVAPEHALWGLLHDAAEAYLADIPRPVKPSVSGWKEIEARMMRAVCQRFGLPEEEPAEVKRVDYAILTDEKVALMADGPAWANQAPPVGAVIRCLSPQEAKRAFLWRFEDLLGEAAAVACPQGGFGGLACRWPECVREQAAAKSLYEVIADAQQRFGRARAWQAPYVDRIRDSIRCGARRAKGAFRL